MINILLVEDNPGDARLIKEYLNEAGAADEYNLIHFDRMEGAIDYLSGSGGVDVVISDIALPDSQGTQSFQKLRKAAADRPVIFCTGTHDEDMALAALQRGAQDYLLKGKFDGLALRRSIRYAIERKRFQNEVERVRRHARQLRQKTALLRKQSEQLMELNKAKDDFISLASHQLRTPATGVKQYLGLLLEGYAGPVEGQQHDFLTMAYDCNERQLKIVSDLLRTAQIDAGQVDLRKSTVDINRLLRGVVDEQSVQVRSRDQTVKVEVPDTPLTVEADNSRLRMAIENLVDNASKYTPAGGKIHASGSEEPDWTILTVRDEGVGIEAADIDKVFSKFHRAKNPLSDEVGGSGLGLYWVRNIIDLHGGTIDVASEVGSGTSFVIRLPRS